MSASTVHPLLENVLVELFNGMLMSHNALAAREHISSQEQPMTMRPIFIQSLDHLAMLLAHAATTSSSYPFLATDSTYATSSQKKKAPPHPPSRLSQSTYAAESADSGTDSSDNDIDRNVAQGIDTESKRDPVQQPSDPDFSTNMATAMEMEAAEMYTSTIEFLALMTAFVSVVCWLMQARLTDNDTTPREGTRHDARDTEDVDMENLQQSVADTDLFIKLDNFLLLFDDHDNVLKPIKDALTLEQDNSMLSDTTPSKNTILDPMKQVGLFAWHFVLFSNDEDGPLRKDANTIDRQALDVIQFDVVLNELYSTHILAVTAKEHQKDHGQFYTPPNVVDFMWYRATIGRENLLGRFVANLDGTWPSQGGTNPEQATSSSLIPTALDPCLGVSTFLSCYIRLLILAARDNHTDAVWNSPSASQLLLDQICENIWGIELDGFAFWIARCGILAALIPLVERVRHLRQLRERVLQDFNTGHSRIHSKLARLHLFRNDTLQLTVPEGNHPDQIWERTSILLLRDPQRLRFDFIVTNPPYMIRKTGTFSAPDPEVYDWSILESGGAPTVSSFSSQSPPTGPGQKAKSRRGSACSTTQGNEDNASVADDEEDFEGSDSETTTPDSASTSFPRSSKSKSSSSTTWTSTPTSVTMRLGAKGMMQAYGYFIWFAAQRIKPYVGVSCMITASQWLTLEFATKLRAWLFENCLMDEFFQFEPFKVFAKVQTDSLIFKFRSMERGREQRDFPLNPETAAGWDLAGLHRLSGRQSTGARELCEYYGF
ncbi:hypothetical protein BG004_007841 [Podila humilis]|nr:hypothetical protein BG004_007841 [Podila humilis]